MEKIRISMLGGSGTGKTSFFSGVIQSMIVNPIIVGNEKTRSTIMLRAKGVKQSSSYFLDDDKSDDLVQSMSNNALLANYLIDGEDVGFGMGTTDSIEFLFDLLINNIPCCEIIIADYAGELIDDPNNEAMVNNLKQLCDNIAESDALIIMADSIIISQHLGNNNLIQRETGARIINMIFPTIRRVIEKRKKPLTTLVALTKSDSPQISEGMTKSNFAAISDVMYNNIYASTFSSMHRDIDSWGIIPVSAIGRGNVDENNYFVENANIQQENIDTAIVFSIASSIAKILSDKDMIISQLTKQYRKIIPIGQKSISAREKLSKEIEDVKSQKTALEDCRSAIAQMNDIFANKINNMHRSNIDEIDAVIKK
ncbi:MAG: hypothetical protein J6I55_06965 [Ruminococcus sp.]|nr:hypothetical protein [Ruminococcus sp.]